MCADLSIPILGAIPLDPTVSERGDRGWPIVLSGDQADRAGAETREQFERIASIVWEELKGKVQ